MQVSHINTCSSCLDGHRVVVRLAHFVLRLAHFVLSFDPLCSVCHQRKGDAQFEWVIDHSYSVFTQLTACTH